MNIWILSSEYPPQTGGIGTYVANAAAMIAASGHNTTVLMPGEQPNVLAENNPRLIEFAPGYTRLNASVPPNIEPDKHPAFPYNVMATWPAMSYQFAEEFKHWAGEFGAPDVIEVQDYAATGYFFLARRWLQQPPFKEIPVLVHLHTPLFEIERINRSPRYKLPNYWIGQMEKFCIRAADGLLAPSDFLRRQIQAQLDPNLKIEVIPYPFLSLPPAQLNPTAGDVLYVGRLEFRKGIVQTVSVCAKLWDQGHQFTLTLIGNDTEFALRQTSMKAYLADKYKRFIEAGQLVFLPPLPREELFERMRQTWCVLVPSIYENYPNVCLEAMSLGLVVLASRQGGQAEMVGADDRAGFLFDWEQPGDFAEKLVHILSLPAEEWANIGQAARRRVAQLVDPRRIGQERLRHFETVIEKGRQPQKYYPAAIPGGASPLALPDEGGVKGLLSVVVPFYNLGDYLEQTIDNILAATYPDLEIIVVDDGSTQASSLAALERVRARGDNRIRVVSTANGGLASARNCGAALARGEYLTFVDADDLIEPDFFAKTVAVLDTYPNVAFVYSWVRHFGAAQGCWITFNTEFPYLLGHNMLTAFAVVRRQLFLQYGQNRPTVEYSLEDYDGWIGMVAAGCVGVSIPELLVKYRIRPDSMYRQMNLNQFLYLYDVITHGHAAAYREQAVDLTNLLLANGASFLWDHPAAEWQSPLEQLAAVQRQHQSIDMTFRLLARVLARNFQLSLRQPGQLWKKFKRWVHFRINTNEGSKKP